MEQQAGQTASPGRDAPHVRDVRDVLAELGDRVAPGALAGERLLPVQPALHGVVPDGGLVRGRVLASTGSAATTLALSLVRDAVTTGGWMAIVDVPTVGADAANELGIPLERVVRVDARMDDESAHARRWAEVLAAAVDGFDVVVTTVPSAVRRRGGSAAVRSLTARIQQRGAVVVVVGATGALPVDVSYTTRGTWDGLGWGHGIARCRRLRVEAAGRRQPRRTAATIDLDVTGRRMALTPVVHEAGRLEHAGGDAEHAVEASLRLAAG